MVKIVEDKEDQLSKEKLIKVLLMTCIMVHLLSSILQISLLVELPTMIPLVMIITPIEATEATEVAIVPNEEQEDRRTDIMVFLTNVILIDLLPASKLELKATILQSAKFKGVILTMSDSLVFCLISICVRSCSDL